MAAHQIPLLDEQEYNQPHVLQELPDNDIDKHNNFMWYFHQSQFFEPMCNNSSLLNSFRVDPQKYPLIHDRKAFAEELRQVPAGLEFNIVSEPKAQGQPWVYQRHNRIQKENKVVEVHVEGNWYNQGTRIMMAPSLLDVVRARLLTVSTRLQQVAELSQDMSHWTAATGYSPFAPSYEAPKAATTASRVGSPTLAPTDPEAAASQSQAQPADVPASTDDFSDALFLQSLNLTNAYGDEYMDENPLTGEPGAFVFEKTRNAVDARNKAQEQTTQAAQAAQQNLTKIDTTQPPSVAPSVAPTPKGVATPAGIEAHSRKGSVAGIPKDKKRERRKSKGLASPTTPGPPSAS